MSHRKRTARKHRRNARIQAQPINHSVDVMAAWYARTVPHVALGLDELIHTVQPGDVKPSRKFIYRGKT